MSTDRGEATRWYRLAAEQGFAEAQSALGALYSNGEGVEQDDAEALRWFTRAADQGVAAAQSYMGRASFNGDGVPRDPRRLAHVVHPGRPAGRPPVGALRPGPG